MKAQQFDLAIAGGGLAGGLVALALRRLQPDLSVALIDAGETFGGNHIWSFFESDIAPSDLWLVEPLISFQWEGYDVRFPKYNRTLNTGYRSIISENFDHIIRQILPKESLLTNTRISKIDSGKIVFSNGETLSADTILDARGGGDYSALEYGWQKFAGQVLHLAKPHGLTRPIVKDATVEQIDGYRFVYALPFNATDVFVEDTYYSADSDLNVAACHQRIADYARDRDWNITKISRSEAGCLPVIYGGDFDIFWNMHDGVEARAGTRAALIHPVTSYSLPMAVRTAIMIASMPRINQDKLNENLRKYARKHWQDSKFYHMLCAMMFQAAKPDKRYLTLEHTYAKDEKLIERFYAGNSTRMDRISLLTGRPPVPVTKALPIMMKYR
ncbi:lycopene beta-cyclase CrtY [Parasphingorhabdus sp. JC815]|uniref:lycopene beta-cyclase CrtY n=1 Tax=Parasphingorhabdus sp. JC815 TaxID=3232140 RepID=UPI00345880F5